MCRRGLSVGRIAKVCRAVPQTVSRHIRGQRVQHPEMQVVHLANRLSPHARPPPPSWLANVAEQSRRQRRRSLARQPPNKLRSSQWGWDRRPLLLQ